MSKDDLYFGVCCFKGIETCTACHCRWFYFCVAAVVRFAGFPPHPSILLLTHFKAQTLWNIVRAAIAYAVGNVRQSQLTQEASWERWFSLTVALNLAAVDGRGSAEDCQLDSPAQGHTEIVDLCLLFEDDISGLCFCSSVEWISRLCVSLKWSVDVI